MTNRRLLAFFLLFRMLEFAIIVGAKQVVPYLGFFPYGEILQGFQFPPFLSSLANFDGVHYLLIARDGYLQYQQAFFPLYPLFVRFLSYFFSGNYLLAGLFISNLTFLGSLIVLNSYFKTSKPATNNKQLTWFFLFLISFPTSFFFGAVYNESLFLFLFILTLYLMKKERYDIASLIALLASLTRLIGLFLFIPIVLAHISKLTYQSRNAHPKSVIGFYLSHKSLILNLVSPLLGFTIYSLYLWKTTGDPFFFLSAQPAFGAHRSAGIVLLPQVLFRYVKIFLTASWNFQYWISLFEFSVFTFVFIMLMWDLVKSIRVVRSTKSFDLIGLSLFSLVNLLLPTLTGTLSSIPRYALLSLSVFIALAHLKNQPIRITILVIFSLIHIVALGFFVQGYFVS